MKYFIKLTDNCEMVCECDECLETIQSGLLECRAARESIPRFLTCKILTSKGLYSMINDTAPRQIMINYSTILYYYRIE